MLRPELVFGDGFVAEFLGRQLVAPILESPLGELHDVALVHQRHRRSVMVDGILDGLAHQPFATELADRLDADGRALAHVFAQPVAHEGDDGVGFFRIRFPLDARIDIFGVLAIDDDVHLLGVLHWAGRAGDVAHRPHAGVEVQHLAQRHVQAAKAAADGRGQRPLDADDVFPHGVEGLFGHVAAVVLLGRLLPGVDLHPGDLAPALVSLFDSRIPYHHGSGSDVDADTVALDVSDDRPIGNLEPAILIADLFAGGHLYCLERHVSKVS